MNQELAKVLAALNALGDLTDAVRKFLSVPEQREALAAAIERGATKKEFVILPAMSNEIYTELRQRLNTKLVGDTMVIAARQGASGGLSLVPRIQKELINLNQSEDEETVADEAEKVNEEELRLERSYYPLVKAWAEVTGFDNCRITGGQIPGHRWENPDLVSITQEISDVTKTLKFSTVSFEVKLRVQPSAVWQAAHYLRFSNKVYVAFARDEQEVRQKYDRRVFELAVELGLGVLCFDAPTRQFKEIQSPQMFNPSNLRVEEMIENLSGLFQDILRDARAFRRRAAWELNDPNAVD
jgi:hypothetical protein